MKITTKPNWAVIMAGGKGVRLRPLTKYLPKPMVKVAGKPILERIINRLEEFGINKFYISINYLGKTIEDYFGNGEKFNCEIKYIKEKKYLHTGGSLSLIKEKFNEPIIVMNADLITRINFNSLLRFHNNGKFSATMGARIYKQEIPFGVIQEKSDIMIGLIEKPITNHLINAGIYVINPEVIRLIPKNRIFPLTKLFEKLVKQKQKVGIYKIKEDWIDVGQIDELERAREKLIEQEENV